MKSHRKRGRPPYGEPVFLERSAVSQIRKITGIVKREDLAREAGIAPEAFKSIENRGHDKNCGVAPQKAVVLAHVTGASARGLTKNKLYPAGLEGEGYTAKDYQKRKQILKRCKEVGPECAAKLSTEIQAELKKIGNDDHRNPMLLLGRIAMAIDRVRKDFAGTLRKKETLTYRFNAYLKAESEARPNQADVWKEWSTLMERLLDTTPDE